jgi:hypothetical protein
VFAALPNSPLPVGAAGVVLAPLPNSPPAGAAGVVVAAGVPPPKRPPVAGLLPNSPPPVAGAAVLDAAFPNRFPDAAGGAALPNMFPVDDGACGSIAKDVATCRPRRAARRGGAEQASACRRCGRAPEGTRAGRCCRFIQFCEHEERESREGISQPNALPPVVPEAFPKMFPLVDPAAGVAAAPNAEPPPPPKILGAPVFPVLLRLKADMARSKGLRPKTRRRARPRPRAARLRSSPRHRLDLGWLIARSPRCRACSFTQYGLHLDLAHDRIDRRCIWTPRSGTGSCSRSRSSWFVRPFRSWYTP